MMMMKGGAQVYTYAVWPDLTWPSSLSWWPAFSFPYFLKVGTDLLTPIKRFLCSRHCKFDVCENLFFLLYFFFLERGERRPYSVVIFRCGKIRLAFYPLLLSWMLWNTVQCLEISQTYNFACRKLAHFGKRVERAQDRGGGGGRLVSVWGPPATPLQSTPLHTAAAE